MCSLLTSPSPPATAEALAREEVTPVAECVTLPGCRKGDRAKDLRLRIESGDESVRASKWENALLCAAGHSPYDLVDSAVAAAAKISGKPLPSTHLVDPELASPKSVKHFGAATHSLGHCQCVLWILSTQAVRYIPSIVTLDFLCLLLSRIHASEDLGALVGTAKPRSAKQFPEFMKSFGWCTWDAFYSQVSAQGTTMQSFSRSCINAVCLDGMTWSGSAA